MFSRILLEKRPDDRSATVLNKYMNIWPKKKLVKSFPPLMATFTQNLIFSQILRKNKRFS